MEIPCNLIKTQYKNNSQAFIILLQNYIPEVTITSSDGDVAIGKEETQINRSLVLPQNAMFLTDGYKLYSKKILGKKNLDFSPEYILKIER